MRMRARVMMVVAALAALLLLSGASAAPTHYVYESEAQVGTERAVSSATVSLVPHGEGIFRMRLADVVVGGQRDLDHRFEAFDALVHIADGLVRGIQFEDGDNDATVTNFKRSVAEALQAPRIAPQAIELTAAGERVVSSARKLSKGGVTVSSTSEMPLTLIAREQRRRLAYFADGETLPERVETTVVIAVGDKVKSTITTRVERAMTILAVDAPLRPLGRLFPTEPLAHVSANAPDEAEVTVALLDSRTDRRELGAIAARMRALPVADADALVRAAAGVLDTVADEDGAVHRRLVSLLTRVGSPAAQAELARLVGAASPSFVVDALFALPAGVTVEPSLIAAVERLVARQPAGSPLGDKAQLLVGALVRRTDARTARGVLAPLVERLDAPWLPLRERVHLLSVLANAGAAVPAEVLAAHLDSDNEIVRAAAARAVAARARIASVAAAVPSADLPAALLERLVDVQSTTTVWNDSSDPLYDLVAPLSERDQDVLRYPSHTAYLTSSTFGGDHVGFRFAAGTFSGSGSSLCLAGNFKSLAKAFFDWNLRGDYSDLLDAAIYAYTFNNEFEARAYVEVFGSLILDINLGVNCTEEHLDIYDATFDILDEYFEYPFDAGTATIAIRLAVGLGLAADYQLCLFTLNPYLDAALRVDMDVEGELAVDLQVKNAIRGGITGAAYFQYSIGPQTFLGGRNSTSGELICEACIGVYASNDAGFAEVVGWYQRREGFGWGEIIEEVFADYQQPANPWEPLTEACSST